MFIPNTNYPITKHIEYNKPLAIKFRGLQCDRFEKSINNKELNPQSPEAQFFGVNSLKSLYEQIFNQCDLTRIKIKQNKMGNFLALVPIDNTSYLQNIKDRGLYEKSLDELALKGASRFSLLGKMFNNETDDTALHTIGLVMDNKHGRLFILDSLPESIQLKYRKILDEEIFPLKSLEKYGIKEKIYSNKKQQKEDEFTCNNWCFANIEAVKNAIKSHNIDSQEKLNQILPENINEILAEQHKIVNQKTNFLNSSL